MRINSRNEWDRLKSVIVGSATHANWPTDDPGYKVEAANTTWHETPPPTGPVPLWLVDEANEDLEILVKTLQDLGVAVYRPKEMNFVERGGMYNYCPRDRLLVHGKTVVDVPMMYPCRNQELENYREVIDSATRFLSMPKTEGMVLDAANICRLNDTLLYLQSSSGNLAAAEWLKKFMPEVKIELCQFYAGVHIDSTISALREGFVVLNASRVTPENCPKVFDGWTKLWVDDVVPQGFYQYPYASKWIGLNMFSVSPDTVIVDKNQTTLIRNLEGHGFTVIPLELRHSRTLGGGFHCVTLDLERESS